MSDKLTWAEVERMFDETIPMDAVSLLWADPGTIDHQELRSKLMDIATRHRKERLLDRFEEAVRAHFIAAKNGAVPFDITLARDAARREIMDRLAW